MHRKVLCVLVFCGVIGCLDATKIAPAVVDLGEGLNVELLETGRNIFLTRCTKCHNAVRITRYPLQYWQEEVLPEMSMESKLNSKQEEALTAYVEAVIAHAILKSDSGASSATSAHRSD